MTSFAFRTGLSATWANGFTLIEAMVVMALAAILAALAMPSFNTMIANQKLDSATQELQNLLQFARTEAVYKRTQSSVTATGQKWEVKVGAQVLREAVISDVVTVIPGSVNGLIFDVTGFAKPNSGNPPYKLTFLATRASRVQCLSVTSVGLIRQEKIATGQSCS